MFSALSTYVSKPESTLRSPSPETDPSGTEDRTHGNKNKKDPHSAGIHGLTLIDTDHKLCHS